MFVERSTQYTSFSSRKQPANAGTERKQFTENASVALQQPILTHAHTKCPPVVGALYVHEISHISRPCFQLADLKCCVTVSCTCFLSFDDPAGN